MPDELNYVREGEMELKIKKCYQMIGMTNELKGTSGFLFTAKFLKDGLEIFVLIEEKDGDRYTC